MATPANEIPALIANSWNVNSQGVDRYGISVSLTYQFLDPQALPFRLKKWPANVLVGLVQSEWEPVPR
jgi:hypothetical protein